MVNLSLKHRVKFEKEATPLDESNHEGSQRVLFALSAAVTVFNVLFLIAGAVTSGIIDYSWFEGNRGGLPAWYRDEAVDAKRVTLVFLYCTTPFVLSALSLFATLKNRRSTPVGIVLAIGVSTLGFVFWIVQLELQKKCVFGVSPHETPAYCGFSLQESWDPKSFWKSGLAVAYYITWCSLCMILLSTAYLTLALVVLKQRRTAGKPRSLPQAYAYHSAVEEAEMHTDRDMPDRSAAPTPVPDDAGGRPPSYRSASLFHEDLTPEREKEMV
ncbi:hypothetical protein LTR56_019533 [Elasticomyces elasticus]|nr:hypothetical protein LTR56_019533 [Elasticomyces elasticus]KAK3653744.1 hypothetical protein LTR22_011122 [Elasticomyces elasticus]KAK4924147.1 hypothetical protein LTR49_008667 [Elasticomyces elasticus]KAK5758495.1 hypothetical protein LTS12_011358 [Elasticomyces elasticus]